MRKLYTLVASIAMAMVSVAAHADGYEFSLPADNTILVGEQYHMRLFKTWDFLALTMNDTPITPKTLNTGAEDASMQRCDGSYKPAMVTNEGMEGWYIGIGNIEFSSSKGLFNNKSGIRYAILTGLKKGQIVCIQHAAATEKLTERIYSEDGSTFEEIKIHDYAVNACRIQSESPDGKMPAWTISYLSNHEKEDVVMEITDSIHTAQEALPLPEGEGNAEGGEGTEQAPTVNPNVDAFRYFRVVNDGPLYIAMGKYSSIQGLQVWIDANAEESVSVPSFKLKSVNGESRDIELTCGESTFGEKCHIMFGYAEEDDYTEPDTDYSDYIESGINVSPDEDGDQDGKVIIEAVTVSATGAKSEPVKFEVEVGEIVLNAPSLTLVGFNEEYRSYQIEWTSNTLEGVEAKFVLSADDDNLFIEDAKVGDIYSIKKNATLTVSATGYTENTTTIDVDYPGVTIVRRDASVEGHDVDFTQPLEETKTKLQGKFVESYYIEIDGEKKYYTAEEYLAGTAIDGTDLDNATPVYFKSGWTWDGKRMRATLDIVSEIIGEGEDQVVNTHYTDGLSLVLPEGITLDCPPNSKGNSQILNYLGNFNLGITCMSRPTLTFDRSVAKAGEIVVITIAAGGGSNFMTYDAENKPIVQTLVYVVPTDNLLSVKLPAPSTGFCHILNIDYYTPGELPADQYDPTAVNEIAKTNAEPVAIFGVSGAKVSSLQNGINIVKMADGSVKKVMVK